MAFISVLQRVVQYSGTELDRLRYAPTRLAGSPMARDLENKRITRVMSLQRVGKVGGSSRSDTDGHDPSLRTPTRLAGSPMARDLENKRITRVISLERVGKVGGSSRSDTHGHDPSLRTPTRLAGSPMARDLENKRIYRIMSAEGRKSLLQSRSKTNGSRQKLSFSSVGFNAINGKCVVGKENR